MIGKHSKLLSLQSPQEVWEESQEEGATAEAPSKVPQAPIVSRLLPIAPRRPLQLALKVCFRFYSF